jgi:hypothetical protein
MPKVVDANSKNPVEKLVTMIDVTVVTPKYMPIVKLLT